MKTVVPDYYPEFRCKAGACRHSCCIGWEIDIDADTYERYRGVAGEFGDRLRRNIESDGETACFRLDERERCPFLNEDGLCDIILEQGESALCQICRDHPRFRADFTDRTEMGLGLCCEEAAELILNRQKSVSLITLSDDGKDPSPTEEEAVFFAGRNTLIRCVQDHTLSREERRKQFCSAVGIQPEPFDFVRWAKFCLSLEQMDPAWAKLLYSAMENPPRGAEEEIAWEQLAVYFLYRHMSASVWEDNFSSRAAFCLLSADMVVEIACRCAVSLPEAARLYSSEIEYSEENTRAILDELYFSNF